MTETNTHPTTPTEGFARLHELATVSTARTSWVCESRLDFFGGSIWFRTQIGGEVRIQLTTSGLHLVAKASTYGAWVPLTWSNVEELCTYPGRLGPTTIQAWADRVALINAPRNDEESK